MRYALDANTCILLLSGHEAVMSRVSQCDEGDLAISAIAFAEVTIGIARGKRPPAGQLEALISRVATLLPFDEVAARCYAALPFKRGSFDRLIAAHAIATDLILITANEADFASIPGLKIENWTL